MCVCYLFVVVAAVVICLLYKLSSDNVFTFNNNNTRLMALCPGLPG